MLTVSGYLSCITFFFLIDVIVLFFFLVIFFSTVENIIVICNVFGLVSTEYDTKGLMVILCWNFILLGAPRFHNTNINKDNVQCLNHWNRAIISLSEIWEGSWLQRKRFKWRDQSKKMCTWKASMQLFIKNV